MSTGDSGYALQTAFRASGCPSLHPERYTMTRQRMRWNCCRWPPTVQSFSRSFQTSSMHSADHHHSPHSTPTTRASIEFNVHHHPLAKPSVPLSPLFASQFRFRYFDGLSIHTRAFCRSFRWLVVGRPTRQTDGESDYQAKASSALLVGSPTLGQ